ncbi:DUF2764 family protein [Chloroflexota bacterium]
MAGDSYYILSSLKTPDDLGSTPPMTLTDFLDRVREIDGNTVLIETIFLRDDLLQRQAYLSGELEDFDPVILSEAQIKGEEPLPDYLNAQATEDDLQSPADLLWANYYQHAFDVANGSSGSDFLKKWIAFEIGLRNALVLARAKSLGLDSHSYMVVDDIGSAKNEFDSLVTEWSSASDPLEGLRVLDRGRWRWINQNDDWFGFSDDELAAYAAKLILLKRWKRLSGQISWNI